MNNDLKFLKGTKKQYNGLEAKSDLTFYFTTDDKELYIGAKKITNDADLQAAIARVAENETNITAIQAELKTLTGDGEEGGDSIQDMINKAVAAAKTELEGKIGNLSTLTTDAKETVVAAINELDGKVDQVYTSEAITIDKSEESEEYAVVYTVNQGGKKVGDINIPKDMVVKSAEVVVITEDTSSDHDNQPAGTYIVLTIANDEATKVYINVGTLVDIYKAASSEEKTKEILVAVDNTTREISATIQDGAVTADKLATGAVTQDKIAEGAVQSSHIAADAITSDLLAKDAVTAESIVAGAITADKLAEGTITADVIGEGAITSEKLDETVQENLTKASTALQKADITTGTENGTIAVSEENVKVAGLKGLAYMDESELDLSAYAKKAEITEGEIDGAIDVAGTSVKVHGLNTLIDAGVEQAKTYTDNKFVWEDITPSE